MKKLLLLFFLLVCSIYSQELTADSKTTLLLHFNNSLTGVGGEQPTQATGITYDTGKFNQGAYLGAGSILQYTNSNKIYNAQGTVEFWLKPNWNGNEGAVHDLFKSNEITLTQTTYNILLLYYHDTYLFADGNASKDWKANQWHHLAITWLVPGSIKIYVDGVCVGNNPTTIGNLITNIIPNFYIGASNELKPLAIFDEFRISNVARTDQEIQSSYSAGLSIKSLLIQTDYTKLWKTWKATPAATAINTDNVQCVIPQGVINWSSSNNNIATVNSSGIVTAISGGSADITGTYKGFTNKVTYNVIAPIKNPVEETINPYLSIAAANCLYEIPVVIIRYLPTTDGINLDVNYSPDFYDLNPVTLSSMKTTLDINDKVTKYILEEGTKYHGYKNPNARPSLGYKIVKIITVYEPVPPGKYLNMMKDRKVFLIDYYAIIERLGLSSFIEANNIKQVWLNYGSVLPDFPSYNPNIHGPEAMIQYTESNMSSPTTGDISNSYRISDDLPILNHTYTVYDMNIRRAPGCEGHMHQWETLFHYVNTKLFGEKFVGFADGKITIPARCGWTHFPPNGTADYDWNNKTLISSDIEDWTPDNTGQRKMVNCDTWNSIPHSWPDPSYKGTEEYGQNRWFIYLMQNWPGYDNRIKYGSNGSMTNWWEFTADWDKAIKNKLDLFSDKPVGIQYAKEIIPIAFQLSQNFPNPFNPETRIEYWIPEAGKVTLKIYDVLGREVETLVDLFQEAGRYEIKWNAAKYSSGVYFYNIINGNNHSVKKMLLLK